MVHSASEHTGVRSFLVATAMIVIAARSGAPQAISASDRRSTVVLAYDEQRISDADRADVARVIARAAAPKSWDSVAVPVGEGRYETVRRLYNVYERAYPHTTNALVALIDSANRSQEWGGHKIAVPPVPVSANAKYDVKDLAFRVFDPATSGYLAFSKDSAPNAYAHFMSDQVRGSSEPALTSKAIRGANVTMVRLDGLTPGVIRQLRALPHSIVVMAEGQSARLKLYGGGVAIDCNDGQLWLSQSPYYQLARKRLVALSGLERAKLIEKAKAKPFVIVDWDFGGVKSAHGKKVVSVAHELLHQLDLDELSPSVKAYELDPEFNRTEAQQWLTKFVGWMGKDVATARVAKQMQTLTATWIDAYVAPRSGDAFDVDEFAMKATLWNATRADSAYYNLSFGVENASFVLQPADFVRSRSGFAFLAAGNDTKPLDPMTSIQNAAGNQPNLVNVTFGSSDGYARGSFSDIAANLPVSLLGPGCGFSYESINAAEWGSSFATPYVGIAAWVSSLLEPTPISEVRDKLTQASIPARRMRNPIQSDGVFDAALLLSGYSSIPHSLEVQGNRVSRIKSLSLDLTIDIDGVRQTFSFRAPSLAGAAHTTVAPLDCPPGTCAVVRMSSGDIRTGQLVGAVLTADTENGSISASSPLEFAAKIRALWL